MKRILTRQLHENLHSLRFQLGLLALLLFFTVNGLVYSWRLEQQAREDGLILAGAAESYSRAKTVAQAVDARFPVVSRRLGTEFIAEAGINWFHDALQVSPSYTGVVFESLRTTNNWMQRFELLDWTVIVRYALSFLCLVLAYNAVSGELESGTLRLILSNPVSRAAFLGGKLLAHLLTLMVATVVGTLVSLLILSLHGVLVLSGGLVVTWLLFMVATTAYAALFLLLGTAISVLTRSSAAAVVVLFTAWTLLVIVVPQTSYLIAVRTVDSSGNLNERMQRFAEEQYQILVREGLFPRSRELAGADGYSLERRFAQRAEELGQEGQRMVRAAYQQDLHQYQVARAVNLVSPGYAYQYSVEALLGTGLPRFLRFWEQGYRYREALREFLRGRDAADPDSPHIPFVSGFMSTRPVAPDDFPGFAQPELTMGERLQAGTVPLVALLLELATAFLFAALSFQRADVAG